ncbi:MAG: imidazole glycerol phosphate synthase subunit HisH, partial [Acutalibacteraceae bacterium]
MQKVIVIDYGMGNLHSVQKALSYLGAAPVLSQNPEEIQAAEKLILPGVGAFADAMAELKQKNLVQAIKQAVKKQTPLMGICLGMQLLFEQSSEGGLHEGLGLMPGEITRFEIREKVPHMGWN